MKPIALAPPLLALLVSGIWIGVQRHSTAELEQQNRLLVANIVKIRSMPRTEENAASLPTSNSTRTEKKAIDWKSVAARIATAHGGGIDRMKSMTQLREQLEAWSAPELLQALDEIRALDLPAESRDKLEGLIAESLAEKDPEALLARFTSRLEDHRWNWQLSNAFQHWAMKDPEATTEWFDRQIATGVFNSKSLDGKNDLRLQFEGVLIGSLLLSDPEASANRLAGLPPEQRKDALSSFRFLAVEQEARTFAELVRTQLPQEDQAVAIAQAAPVDFSADYGKITDYLNRIAATPAERDVCVEESGSKALIYLSTQRKLNQGDFDRMREWVMKESPAISDRTTGEALAMVLNNRGIEFPAAVEIARHYHENGAGDEVLLPVLKSWPASENKDVARELTGWIADEKRRDEILKTLD